jgi:hypothetical protein
MVIIIKLLYAYISDLLAYYKAAVNFHKMLGFKRKVAFFMRCFHYLYCILFTLVIVIIK